MQAGHIILLAGELAVRGQGIAAGAGGAAARFAVRAVGLAGSHAAAGGGEGGGAEMVRVEVV